LRNIVLAFRNLAVGTYLLAKAWVRQKAGDRMPGAFSALVPLPHMGRGHLAVMVEGKTVKSTWPHMF
jgi:hypothetical protein